MSERVYILDSEYQYWLQWETDGEPGALLGEAYYTEKDFAKLCASDSSDRWYAAATMDVAALKPARGRNEAFVYEAFVFDTRRDAERALNVAKAAKSRKGPMPEWALKATAAGWKAPKGWKP